MGKKKKETMTDLHKRMYESYCNNMKFYGKEPLPYKQWIKEVNEVKL